MRTNRIAYALAIGALVVPLTSAMSPPVAAPQAAPCTATWRLEPTPEPVPGQSASARTVSAISKRDVRISGTVSAAGPWTAKWDGRSVRKAPTPHQGLARTIDDVRSSSSYSSPDEGWVLLGFPARSNAGIDTAAHWQNGRWTLTPTAVPDNPVPHQALTLVSVASVAPDDAWAVGNTTDEAGWLTGLIEHWDGVQWTVVDHPEATRRGSILQDVIAVSPTDVWAVGQASPTGGWTEGRPLVMHYDGSAWRTVPLPELPEENSPARLRAVSATADGHIWAIGDQDSDEGFRGRPLILNYNGSAWRELPDPAIGDDVEMVGVYAAAQNNVWAVANNGQGMPVLLNWNGKGWQIVEWPGDKEYIDRRFAFDMDGTGPDDVWVVGEAHQVIGDGNGQMVPISIAPEIAHLICKRK
jgi:hypothetical protein